MKMQILICFSIFMLVGREKECFFLLKKEWNSYKDRKYLLGRSEISIIKKIEIIRFTTEIAIFGIVFGSKDNHTKDYAKYLIY